MHSQGPTVCQCYFRKCVRSKSSFRESLGSSGNLTWANSGKQNGR